MKSMKISKKMNKRKSVKKKQNIQRISCTAEQKSVFCSVFYNEFLFNTLIRGGLLIF